MFEVTLPPRDTHDYSSSPLKPTSRGRHTTDDVLIDNSTTASVYWTLRMCSGSTPPDQSSQDRTSHGGLRPSSTDLPSATTGNNTQETMWKPNRTPVRTQDAPLPPSFLSQAIVAGSQVYCSGQVGVSPSTGKMVEGPIQERTKQILRNLSAVLTAGGSSLQDVMKVNIFLADMGDFAAVNEVYETFFQDPKPARTCVAVKTLPLGTDVEIECTGLVTKRTAGSSRL